MKTLRLHNKEPGQSIPFIALIIVVLFGMVGLAVDVGNTYAEQRNTVRASNAASLAGMTALMQGGDDGDVRKAIVASLESNDIQPAGNNSPVTADTRRLNAYYLGADGNPLVSCDIGSCGVIPRGVSYIQVQLDGHTDTFFARIVDRDTLPVNAQSFAAQCAPIDNVFPIGVRSDYLDAEGFKEPTDAYEQQFYGKYVDENYGRGGIDVWQRRIYIKDNAEVAGGFSYLRWLDEPSYGNAPGLANMLTGDGNLGDGFEEADWPEGKPGKPDGYAIRPGQLSPGDWVHGNSGLSNSNAVRNQLQSHIDRRTEMILPLIEDDSWQGNNATFLASGFGKFYLRGYGNDGSRGWYMDLVYLGKPNNVPCTLTNVPTTGDTLSVKGNVFVRPQEQEIPSSRQPVDYVMLLDTSGSMNWNFAGRAHKSNGEVQCTHNPATPDVQAIKCGGAKWNTTEERRIYHAKQSMMSFIDKMEPEDAMTIIGYSSNNYNMKPTGTRQFGTPEGKAELRKSVLNAGKTGSDPYTVGGGTPSPRALMTSRQVLAGLPETAANGKEFKRVVIFLTDGVANHFDKKYKVPWGNNQWYNKATDDPVCENDPNVGENVNCQTGFVNDEEGGIMRPITSMVHHGQALQQDDVIVYAIMMGAANSTGLNEVASQKTFPWYSVATRDADVDLIFDAINNDVENGDCIPREPEGWIAEIEPQNEPAGQPYGWVIVYDQNNVEQDRVPIKHDEISGKLTYEIRDIAPGTYRLEAYVNYKGGDGIERQYSELFNMQTLKPVDQVTQLVSPSDTLNDTVVGKELRLDLDGAVCAAQPGPSGP